MGWTHFFFFVSLTFCFYAAEGWMFQIALSLGYLFNKACATRQQKAIEFLRSYSIYTRKNL